MVRNLQGLSILVALILRSLGPNKDYESDDDYDPARLPLIKHGVQPAPCVGPEQGLASNITGLWNVRFSS